MYMDIDLTISENTIKDDFARIANELLNKWILKVGGSQYRIAEIEFYYKDDNQEHDDSYIHGHAQQRQKGKWYFHGAGIDITFGNGKAFGGILIRAMVNIDTNEYFYGPLVCIQELFRNFSTIFNTEINFGLVPSKNNQVIEEKIIRAPRVGLNPTKNPEMWNELYRFLIIPKLKHADKTKIFDAMKLQGFSEEECKNIWG